MGCGWLELPLAEQLAELGYEVKGSTASKERLDLPAGRGLESPAFHETGGVLNYPENTSYAVSTTTLQPRDSKRLMVLRTMAS